LGRREREQVQEYRLGEGERNGGLCVFLSFSSGTTGLPKAVCRPNLLLHSLEFLKYGGKRIEADQRNR